MIKKKSHSPIIPNFKFIFYLNHRYEKNNKTTKNDHLVTAFAR